MEWDHFWESEISKSHTLRVMRTFHYSGIISPVVGTTDAGKNRTSTRPRVKSLQKYFFHLTSSRRTHSKGTGTDPSNAKQKKDGRVTGLLCVCKLGFLKEYPGSVDDW